MVNIEKTLLASTGHITKKDAANLPGMTGTDRPCSVISYEKGEYGWFIHVKREPEDIAEDEASMKVDGFSDAFIALIALARKHDCDWLQLDNDAPKMEGVEVFEW